MGKKISNSRPARWGRAAEEARKALDALQAALEALGEVKEEYQEWQDNLPENLQSGALADKLQEVCDIDLECLSEVEEAVEAAENADLPLGFGRD